MVHRSSQTLHNNEKGADLNPPIAACCRGAPPVLAFKCSLTRPSMHSTPRLRADHSPYRYQELGRCAYNRTR
jgi:hypothetical protein